MTPPSVKQELELTILMPALNEERTVATCVRKAMGFLERSGIHGEVLIADNGSTDATVERAEAAGARVVHVSEKGYGAAIQAGIEAAHGRYIIMADSDDSYDLENLQPFVEALRSGYQMVVGNRFKGGIKPGAMPKLHRYFGNPVLSFIGRLLFKIPLGDFHCGLRGFERDAILRLGLQCEGMDFASEMIVKAAFNNLNTYEVPTTLSPDGRDRPPHLNSWRDGWRHLRFLLLHAPSFLFMYPGLICLGVGGVLSSLIIARPQPLLGATLDIHSLMYTGALVCLGLQMVFLASTVTLYGRRYGLILKSSKAIDFICKISLKRILIVAFWLFVMGIALGVSMVRQWHAGGVFHAMDPIETMRWVIPSAMCLLASAQMVTGGFLLAALKPEEP